MWKALWWKEVRECGLFAGLALLAQIQVIGGGMDVPLIPLLDRGRAGEIPFLSNVSYGFDRQLYFASIAIGAAVVLGLQQTVWESWRQTTLFLLHRPMPRDQIFLGKLSAGAALLLAVTVVPLGIYCLWSASPGTHASPFFWSMTEPWWRSVLVAVVCYLGAFLAGLRPARWVGSRIWPAIAAIVLALFLLLPPLQWALLAYFALFGLAGALIVSIRDVAGRREFP